LISKTVFQNLWTTNHYIAIRATPEQNAPDRGITDRQEPAARAAREALVVPEVFVAPEVRVVLEDDLVDKDREDDREEKAALAILLVKDAAESILPNSAKK
jgi:hypothetical protein